MLKTVPVLESSNIKNDLTWYSDKLGFTKFFGDDMYAGIEREGIVIHLQWHAGTVDDPVNGGAVVKIFVEDIMVIFEDLVKRKTIAKDKLNLNTAWGTHEIGLYDLNKNSIFFVQAV